MPVFSLRRRTQPVPSAHKSSSPACDCELRPLRVFCIPCVFVVPSTPCSCHCAASINAPSPESSSASSPLHVSATTTLTPATAPSQHQPVRNAAETPLPAHRRAAPPAPHNSSDVNALSSLAPSSFLHDLNANMTVVLNLTDSSHTLSPTPTFITPGQQTHASRALTAVQPNNAPNTARSEPEPSLPHTYSSSESRDMLDDDSDITEETSYDSIVKQLQQTSPEAFSRALQAVKAPDLSADSRKKLMAALENALRTLCIERDRISLPHSNVRIEAYTALASFYASPVSSPDKGKVLDYCQSGLDLAAGRERLFPQLVATLHALKARVLVSLGDLSRIPEAIAHAKSAQVALYAIRDPKLQYEVCVTLGDAYTVLSDGTTCDNIRSACECYNSAIQLSKMAALESPIKVMWLSCRVAQLTLRFLRNTRGNQSAKDNEQHGGRKGAAMSNMSVLDLVIMVEQLQMDVEKLREGEVKVSEQVRQLESVVCECVGKAYFERARTSSSKVQDLKKAASSLQRALALCSWEADSHGQRYAAIQESIDDVQSYLKTAEAASNQSRRR